MIWSTIKEQRGACHAAARCLFVLLFRARCDLLRGLFMLSNANLNVTAAIFHTPIKRYQQKWHFVIDHCAGTAKSCLSQLLFCSWR